MNPRTEVLLWAQRIVAKKGAAPHQLLEIGPDAGMDEAQAAFHKIARIAHPDLHRTTLTAEELEMVTTAYARVAGAYQDFRSQRAQTTRIRPVKDAPVGPTKSAPPTTPDQPGAKVEPMSPSSSSGASGAMSSKALVYYRKAELCLRRGDLRGAVLQLKMAIAADPKSSLLRTALTEVEAEVGKKI